MHEAALVGQRDVRIALEGGQGVEVGRLHQAGPDEQGAGAQQQARLHPFDVLQGGQGPAQLPLAQEGLVDADALGHHGLSLATVLAGLAHGCAQLPGYLLSPL
jgi:hypothetical protein